MTKNIEKSTIAVENVAAYIRVSTQEQKLHGLSLDAQKMKLTEYAEKNNMKIVEWYMDEGVSGRKPIRKRPELQRMIIDAEAGKFERIIFIKLDRFFRSVAEYHECMKRIDPVVWSTTEEQYDLTTANGRLLVNMKLTIAELEADQTSERIKIVNEYKVTAGQPLNGSRTMPTGLTIAEENGKKKVVPDPDVAPIVADIFRHYATYQNKRQTLIYLQDNYGIKLNYTSLSKLFENRMLIGEYRNNPKYCEPVVDRELFDRVQVVLGKNLKRSPASRIYKFAGLLICPVCGKRLVSGYNVQNYKDTTYISQTYRCPDYHMKRCSFDKRVFENTIERMLLDGIENQLADAKLKYFEISQQQADAKKAEKHNIENLYEQIDRLNYSWRTGKIKKVETYEKDYAEIMAKIDAAQAASTEIKEFDFGHIEKALSEGWQDIYMALDDEHKRAFWRSFIDTIELDWMIKGKKNKRIKKVNFF